MAEHDPRNRAPAPLDPRVLSIPVDDDPPPFDANGFDPAEFEWRPVPRRPRADGWTPDVQRAFIQALADTGLVEQAAQAVNMSVQSASRLRRAAGSETFARAWTAALVAAAERVQDLAFARAIEGEDTPVFDRDGCRIGARWRTNDRLTMFILRAYFPERYGRAHEAVRPLATQPPVVAPVAEAMAALAPPVPAEPHRLLAPDRLEALVEGARGMAEVDALYPPDDRERYVYPRREESHPAAAARAIARRKAEMKRQRAADDPED